MIRYLARSQIGNEGEIAISIRLETIYGIRHISCHIFHFVNEVGRLSDDHDNTNISSSTHFFKLNTPELCLFLGMGRKYAFAFFCTRIIGSSFLEDWVTLLVESKD